MTQVGMHSVLVIGCTNSTKWSSFEKIQKNLQDSNIKITNIEIGK